MNVVRATSPCLRMARRHPQHPSKTAFNQFFPHLTTIQSITPTLHHKTIGIGFSIATPKTADYLESAIRQALKQPVEELKHDLLQEIRTELQTLHQLYKQQDGTRYDSHQDHDEIRYE